MKVFEYDSDKLVVGVTEGGGAPMLIIEGYLAGRESYVFASPEQVSEFIKELIPFADPRSLA